MDHPHLVGHVHLKVRDLDRAVDFYAAALGLDVTERHADYAFLSWEQPEAGAERRRHHDVALQAVGPDAEGPGTGVGLYHAAFEVDSAEALRATYERLRERGVPVSPVDHGISRALYFEDPDGNGLEVYRDTRAERDTWEWGGESERFDPLAE